MPYTQSSEMKCTSEQLMESAQVYGKSPYGTHMKAIAEGRILY